MNQKGCQKRCQIDQKTMKNQVCVLGAFRPPKRGGAGCRDGTFWDHFRSNFRAKVEKRHPKIDAKIDAEKVKKNDAKMDQK